MRRVFFLAALILAAFVARPAAAQQLDVIRGRVIGPDTMPLQGVNVKVMSYQGSVTKTTKTDKKGRYTVTYPNGEGDYWIEFTAIGFTPKRFEIKRVADEEILEADTKLASNIATLEAVNVTTNAARALVNRNDVSGDAGGGDKAVSNANLPPDQMGNLAAMASGIPGIQLIPGMDGAADMFSALGLGADQNATTLNGLGSSVTGLPPDAQVRASVQTYSYDPSIGGFSGARISLSSLAGSNYSNRRLSSNAVAPDLEFPDQVAEDENVKYTNLLFGGGFGGPLKMDKDFYNTSFSVSRNFKDLPSLLNTNASGLAGAGVAQDSVARFLDILRRFGIPTRNAGNTETQATNTFNVQGNVDIAPGSSGTGSSLTFAYLAGYRQSQNIGSNGLLGVPARNAENDGWNGSFSLRHTKYLMFGVLSNTTAGITLSNSTLDPYLSLPSGSVRVNSDLGDGNSAVRSLSFGGFPNPHTATNTRTMEINNELRWYAGNNKHIVKVTTSLRNDEFVSDPGHGFPGSFSFNSLADLEAGAPASFSRILAAPRRDGSQFTGAVSLGDYWRLTPNFQLSGGLRVDANHFLTRPDSNPLIESTFGVRNDNVPNKMYLSPRLGFTWIYGKQNLLAFVPGAARPPRALIQGGAGVFQNIGPATLLSQAAFSTGLPGSTQQISCVGPAAPLPDWNDYLTNPSAIPSQCADGTGGTVFSNATPSVTLFDPRYEQPRVWRSNINWSGPILDNRFALGVSALYSLNLNQTGASVDINLDRDVRFALDNEAGRPVFGTPSAIDPRTGSIASLATRVDPALSRVSVLKSDLRSDARTLFISLQPVTANPKLHWQLSYNLQAYRDEYRGFSSTVSDPFLTQWGRSQNAGRHTFSLGFNSFPIFDLVYLSWSVSATSGATYTPTVSGDINGDGGFNNDRAYIFDPATADSAVSAGMRSLLANGSASARRCLMAQMGQLSMRGSCQAPWTAAANLNFRFNPQKIGLPKRTSILFSITNPLGIIDLASHGQDIHGWGMQIAPDPTLLLVRGFDPVTQRYKYEVNERFGSTKPTQTTTRVLPYVSLRVILDIGAPRERQVLTQRLDMGRGRPGTKQSAAMIKSVGTSSIPNPMALILQQPDSLKLTRKQADSLAAMSRAFTQHADSLWTPVAKALEALPSKYSHDDAYGKYVIAREKTIDYLITLAPSVKSLLTRAQKRRLPPTMLNLLDTKVLGFLRSSSAGDISPLIMR